MNVEETVREGERALLGKMLSSPAALWRALDLVQPSDYYDPKHEVIALTIAELAAEGVAADALGVVDRLLATGEISRVPADYVFGLTSAYTGAASVEYTAEIVKRHAGLRIAARAATLLGQGVADGREVGALIDEARRMLDGAADTRSRLDTIGDLLPSLADELDRQPVFRPTPWRALNGFINGLMPGGVYVIAARPGSGKTIMGMQLALDASQYGGVAYFSLEMPKMQLLRRVIAQEADVSLGTLFRHSLAADDWSRIGPAQDRLRERPLYIDDRSRPSITQMESVARQVAQRGPLAAMVVDYLGLIPNPDSRKSRWEHIGDLTRQFKIMAKELGIPVVLLVQLNRESERNQRLPQLSDLRDSGSIEQDADVVLMLQRQRDKLGEQTDVLDVVIAKNRHGQQGRVELLWEGKYARLGNLHYGTPTVDYASRAAGSS